METFKFQKTEFELGTMPRTWTQTFFVYSKLYLQGCNQTPQNGTFHSLKEAPVPKNLSSILPHPSPPPRFLTFTSNSLSHISSNTSRQAAFLSSPAPLYPNTLRPIWFDPLQRWCLWSTRIGCSRIAQTAWGFVLGSRGHGCSWWVRSGAEPGVGLLGDLGVERGLEIGVLGVQLGWKMGL